MPRRIVGGTSALALLLLGAAYTYHFLYWNFDDTYIVFRIVRNLLSGHGWAFNAGEAHNASTSVLNTIVVALATPLFSWNIPFASHMLAGLWLSVAAQAFGWIFWQRFDPSVALGAGVGLVVVLADNILWGLETHLFFALLGIFAVLEHRRSRSWWAIGLLTLTRPDALILAVLRWLRDVRLSPWPASVAGWRESLRAPWVANRRGLLVFALVLAPWVIFSLITFHQLLPDTLSNKMWQARSGFWGMGWVYLDALRSHLADFAPWRVTGYVLALPGLVFLIRDRSVLLYVVAFAAIQQAAYILLNVPGYHWYFVSFDVAIVLAAFHGAGSILEIAFRRYLRAARLYASVALYVAVLAFAGVRARPLFGAHYPQDAREVSYQNVAAALLAHRVPAGSIAIVEVGTVGYHMPNHSIVDLIGLTSSNPEYVTGRNNDRFFAEPPSIVLFHAPSVSPLERALFDDIRFRMMYADPVVVDTVEPRMQYFKLRPGARPPTLEEIAAYVQQEYAPFQLEVAGPLVDARPSGDAFCALDHVNGQPGSQPLRVPRLVLSLTGWAYDRAEPGAPAEVFALLRSAERRYSIRATRVARPDVAAVFKEPRFEMSGYTLQGSIVPLPPGDYQVSILQKRGAGFVSCDAPGAITITDAVR
ncbi:MAG TPA: hypothetical protein VFO21_05885 [Vicinamibacterales bacterium]|nr:hypothetical protein [Vicinamibacterales bacterium]